MFDQQEIKEPFLTQYFGVFLCFIYRKQNRLVINVGCHEPHYITFYSNVFCKVITVDPMLAIKPDKYSRLENLTNSQIILEGSALGAMPRGDIIFYRCIDNMGISTTIENNYNRMREDNPEYRWETHSVSVKSLDHLYPDCEDLDFLKIDAENEDVNILFGAKNIIAKNLPIIQIEHDTDENLGHEILIYMGYEKIEPPFKSTNSYYVHTKDIIK